MFKMLATLAIFFLCLGFLVLISIWAFTCFVLCIEKTMALLKEFRIERMEDFINRKSPRLNGNLIAGKIKSIWKLNEVYLVPCPVPVKFRVMNRAFVSSYLINEKLNLIRWS